MLRGNEREPLGVALTNAPSIDVLLVTFNHEAHIARALESVFCQDYSGKIRVIVADDASTDSTLLRIKEQVARQARVEFVFLDSTQNRGITRNYQRAFAACAADFVAVLDGDDYWASTKKLLKQIEFLEEHRACVACGCNYFIHEPRRHSYDLRVPDTSGYKFLTARSLIADNTIGNFSTCVYRRAVLQQLPPAIFSLTSYDWIVNICVAMHGVIGFLCEPLSVYHIHEQGTWNRLSTREKLEGQLALIPQYDEATSGRFSKEFARLAERLRAQQQFNRNRFRYKMRRVVRALSPPAALWMLRRISSLTLFRRARAAFG